jgi:hypothetical protein
VKLLKPLGRKAIPTEIKSLARVHCPSAINTLKGIMLQAKSGASARVAAAIALLDRGYGKPEQTVAGKDGEDGIRITIRHMIESVDDDDENEYKDK